MHAAADFYQDVIEFLDSLIQLVMKTFGFEHFYRKFSILFFFFWWTATKLEFHSHWNLFLNPNSISNWKYQRIWDQIYTILIAYNACTARELSQDTIKISNLILNVSARMC